MNLTGNKFKEIFLVFKNKALSASTGKVDSRSKKGICCNILKPSNLKPSSLRTHWKNNIHLHMFLGTLSVILQSFNQSVQFSHSVPATPWTAACQASLSITNSQSLLKLMSSESVMPSNHLILCHPLLLPPSVFPSIRVFSNESILHISWPKYWSFSFSNSPSNEYSGLTFFRMDFCIFLRSKGLSRVFPNTILQNHQFFGIQLSLESNSHIHT